MRKKIEKDVKRKDSIYFIEIKVDERFIQWLDDEGINEETELTQKLPKLCGNENFKQLILNELEARRLNKKSEFKKKQN